MVMSNGAGVRGDDDSRNGGQQRLLLRWILPW